MRKTDHESQKNGQAATTAETRSAAQQPQLPFFDAVMPPTMTTENTSPNDAHAATDVAVDPHSANGTGAELIPADAGTLLPQSATPEAAHQAALAADAIAREGADDAPDDAPTESALEPDTLPAEADAAAPENVEVPAEFETAADHSAQAATDAHVESEAVAESVLTSNAV